MAFTNYRTVGDALKSFQIFYQEEIFIEEQHFSVPNYFREDLEIVLKDGAVNSSEFAICENLIYPILKEIWKNYRDRFTLWSHHYLNYDQDLQGFPEYILARRSPLGKVVFDKPYLVIVEAKQDNFDQAWGQCIVEMVAAQNLNEDKNFIVYGITSNGTTWQFGKLRSNQFILNEKYYTIQQLDELFAAVNFVFSQCAIQLQTLIPA